MQAFLHFSSNQPHHKFMEFVNEIYITTAGMDLVILSQSETLGSSAFFRVQAPVTLATIRDEGHKRAIDVNFLSEAPYQRRLMLCDMDSTIITSESLDHLAELAGISEAVKPITARAMAGEIDFEGALHERLKMLKDYPASLLEELIDQTDSFTGARELVQTMRDKQATCLLVSGGFTFLTQVIGDKFGLHHHYANELSVTNGRLDGYAIPPILDSTAKVTKLNEYCQKLELDTADAICMGDGANDIPMLQSAGLGIAWQGKQRVRELIDTQLNHSHLTGALFLQGITEAEIK